MKPLEGNRTCHRLVNGVLVERTVSQVLPALTTNYEHVQTYLKKIVLLYFLDEKAPFKSYFVVQKSRRRTSPIAKEHVNLLKTHE